MNLLGKRYLFFALSALVILPGLIILATGGLPLSIDFTGGSLLEVTFSSQTPSTEEILSVYDKANIKDATVQTTETGNVVIRSEFLDNDKRDALLFKDSSCSASGFQRLMAIFFERYSANAQALKKSLQRPLGCSVPPRTQERQSMHFLRQLLRYRKIYD